MSLTITKEPDDINFSGNPVIVETTIEESDMYTGTAVFAHNYITFARGADVGESFTLLHSLTGLNVVYTASATPLLDNEIPCRTLIETLNAWLLRIKTRLESLYFFSTYYNIAVDDDELQITARYYGVKYSNTLVTYTAGLITSDTRVAGDDKYARNPVCVYQFFVYQDAVWNIIVEDFTPYFEYKTKTDISQFINSLLTAAFTYPNTSDHIIVHTASKLDFKVRCFLYSMAVGYGNGVESDEYIAIQGKVPHYYAAQSNEQSEDLYYYFQDYDAFLTYAPIDKRSDLVATEKLYFFVETCDHLKIGYKIYYSDDTTTSGLTAEQTITTSNIVELLVNKLTALFDTAKTVTKYEVWLEGAIGAGSYSQISETRTFTIDPDYYENRREYLFKSDMYYDTLIIRGVSETNIELSREFIEIDLPDDFETNTRVKKQVDSSVAVEKIKANTGWLTRDELDYFMQFFKSDDVFEIIEDSKTIPITITDTKFFKNRDNEYLYAIEFEYEQIAGTAATPVLGQFNDDFNNDFNI